VSLHRGLTGGCTCRRPRERVAIGEHDGAAAAGEPQGVMPRMHYPFIECT
jgi:hypothetical protein